MRDIVSLCVTALLFATACGHSGVSCEETAQCPAGEVCLRPQFGPNEPAPPPGSCVEPRSAEQLCYRAQDCKEGLLCVLPAGGTPAAGGSCQPVT
jgi:hypothetical protein